VVTIISIAGVAAGVAALIIALAITNGMRRDLEDRLLGVSAHVDLMRVEADGIRDWQPLLARLRRVPPVSTDAKIPVVPDCSIHRQHCGVFFSKLTSGTPVWKKLSMGTFLLTFL